MTNLFEPAGMASRCRMVRVDMGLVDEMSGQLRAQTAECVMQTFGISVNTWVKLKKGEAIRESVASRLFQRLDSLVPG